MTLLTWRVQSTFIPEEDGDKVHYRMVFMANIR